LTRPEDQVAIIGFDNRFQVLMQFTSDSGDISTTLASITSGNSGAAIFDSVHLALGQLQEAPMTNRKLIVLVSEEHDHGSNASDIGSLIRPAAGMTSSSCSHLAKVAR
jgi:methylglyoxal synthase